MSDVENAIKCYGGSGGFYFGEAACSVLDIAFALKKATGGGVEEDCQDGGNTDLFGPDQWPGRTSHFQAERATRAQGILVGAIPTVRGSDHPTAGNPSGSGC